MALIVSDDVLQKVNMTAGDLLVELACYLYESKKLSFGKARNLVDLGHIEFQNELSKRKINIHYTREDLTNDLENLGIDLQ